jgi:hypothetical protein
MYFPEEATRVRQDQGTVLIDGLQFERENWAELRKHHINASTVEEADYSHFLQDYKNIHPIAIRSISVDSSYQSSGSLNHEFEIPVYGTYMYGFKPQLFIDGLIAAKAQDASHGENQTAQGYVDYGDNSVTQATLISGSTKKLSDWTSFATHVDKLNPPMGKMQAAPKNVSIWNDSASPPTWGTAIDITNNESDIPAEYSNQNSGSPPAPSLNSSTWYYIHAVAHAPNKEDELNTNNSQTNLTMYLVPANAYTNLVAEGKNQEPYYYAPGYTIGNDLIIEALQTDVLFHTTGEYSYFLNQLFRDWNHNKEDEKLAKVHTDDRFRLYSDAANPGKHFTSREMAQRKSRTVDTVYTPFVHPFQNPKNSIPVPQVFSTQIRFKMNMLEPRKAVVMPKNDTFDKSDLKVRPAEKSKSKHFSNEDIRRGKKNLDKMKDLEDNKPQARLELIIVDAHQNEEDLLTSSAVPNFTRQPQVWHFDVPSSDSGISGPEPTTGLADLTTNKDPQMNKQHPITPDGYASEILVYARQQKRIDAGKMYDLRSYQDPVTQRWQSALFTVGFEYENHPRSMERNCNKGTSENVQSTFYDNMPDFGVEGGGLHIIPFAVCPSTDTEYSGVASLSNQRVSHVNTSLNRNAFHYVDEQGNTSLTDLVVTALVHTYQIFHFGVGSVVRNFQYHDTPARTPRSA